MPKLSLSLPKKGKILVSVGDKVSRDDVLAEYSEQQKTHLDLKKILGVSSHKIYRCLIKKPGTEVKPGEIIAQKKFLFSRKVAKCSVSGTIESLEEGSGVLTILVTARNQKLVSPVTATVDEVTDGKTVVLDFNGESYDVKFSHGNKCSLLRVLTDGEKGVSLYDIKKEMEHQILVGFFWPVACIRKAFALDCGVIGVSLELPPDKILKNATPDAESSPLMVIGRDLYALLKNTEGKVGVMLGKETKLFVQNNN